MGWSTALLLEYLTFREFAKTSAKMVMIRKNGKALKVQKAVMAQKGINVPPPKSVRDKSLPQAQLQH